ncbi:protein JTB [Ascaphus truei]|uniref:protein JTB n=1 Tax=Ascaphus truei TaxID=8439 RepID=UPI003F59AC6A
MGPGVWVLGGLLLLTARPAGASLPQDETNSDSHALSTQCWMAEEFVISKDCSLCNNFQSKTVNECKITGFIEEVSCGMSKKEEYKSCRSVAMEKEIFWKFAGSMMAAAVALSLLVVFRQRTLDWRALEKVRKQIESI